MTHDSSDEKPSPLVTPPAVSGGRWLLLSGVAVACGLGAGLGLWARPALDERPVATDAPPPMPPVPRRELRIVVDAPAGSEASAPAAPSPVRIAENALPVRPVLPLVRVQAPPPPAPAARVVAMPAIVARPAPPPEPPRLVKAVVPAAAPPKVVRKAEQIEASKARPGRKVLAKTPTPPAKPKLQLVKAKPQPAKAPPLARLIKATHAQPHATKPTPKLEKVRLVQAAKPADRKSKLQRPTLKPQKVAAAAPKLAPHKPAHLAQATRPQTRPPAAAPARPAGLMKVANTSRCALADPGAAIVCANPALGAADRQMNRAYQDAKAAGVPEWRLQRQQQRWLAARTAAAREAPWAVHDVYQARIAELNGMAREAQSPSN